MRRILAFYLSGAALAAAALAQETSAPAILVPSAPAPATPAAPAAAPKPSAPVAPTTSSSNAGDKPQSSELSAMLSATMPAYAPPAPPAPPKPETETQDLRDVDKPKNRILRLPKYVVHAEKPPIFRDKDIYTADGIARLAMLRYQGLGLLPGSQLNTGVATEMWQEADRLKNMAALEDTASSIQAGGDKDEAKFIRQASQSTYQQGLDWGTAGVPNQNPSAYGANGLK